MIYLYTGRSKKHLFRKDNERDPVSCCNFCVERTSIGMRWSANFCRKLVAMFVVSYISAKNSMRINGTEKTRSKFVKIACNEQQLLGHHLSVLYVGSGKQKTHSVKINGAGAASNSEGSAPARIATRSANARSARNI